MFKPGSIRKVAVQNFVTYNYAEIYPGPKLNMLIGPNGTGKSTIVAAIILGLGGNPKSVGRGSKVSEYVKHNCEEATINIFLQGEDDLEYIKIKRSFNLQNKTTWTLNNQKVAPKDIMDCIQQYNIQVDNLCQFLPQDRVQDFAKMNPQQLLRETQLALCRDDLVQMQYQLASDRENYKKIMEIVRKNTVAVQEAQDANVRLEGKVENFKKKLDFLSKIQNIDRKFAWLHYNNLYDKAQEVKIDLESANQVYEKHVVTAKPMEKKILVAKKMVGELQQKNSEVTRQIRTYESLIRTNIDKSDSTQQTIRRIISEMNLKIAESEQIRNEIESTAKRIEESKTAQRDLLNKCGNDQEIKQKVLNLNNEMQKFRKHASALGNKRDEILQSKQNAMAQKRAHENKINLLENVKQQRLDYLQRVDKHAYEAVMWLRNNKHLFKGEVFEPIMLELNVLDPKHAKYIENVIPIRDRVAFTCVEKEDMNAFIRYLRDEKRWTINILHSGNTGNSSQFQPSVPIEQLRKFGLYTYLHSLFTAPEAIMRYLCKTYRVHEIPVGNNEVVNFIEQIPKQIRVFFSEKQRFTVNFSKYTGEKSVMQNNIRSDGGLSISVNVLYLQQLKGEIDNFINQVGGLENEVKEYDGQINLINEKITRLNNELRSIGDIKRQAELIDTRILNMQTKIKEMKQHSGNVDIVRNESKKKIQKAINNIQPIQEQILATYKSLSLLMPQSNVNWQNIENARQRAAYLENKIEEVRRAMKEAEETVNRIREAYANIKGQAKAALQKAKTFSKNFTPDDKGFNEFREAYDSLPDDFALLRLQKDQLTARIDCLQAADDDEMKDYESRLNLIESLQKEMETNHMEMSCISDKMDKLKAEWLAPLNHLIDKMNNRFSTSFERMGCAGEVSLDPGDDETEYSQYGLCVKVTYRNGEPLQKLNNFVQSGGERAVATAAFMLSLQELTPVPFRCVDEINQGMDAINERRIFDLLVDSTSQDDTAQYFLITPKLVPNLKFCRSQMVHFVHNGPFVEQDKKWSMSKLCNPQGVTIY